MRRLQELLKATASMSPPWWRHGGRRLLPVRLHSSSLRGVVRRWARSETSQQFPPRRSEETGPQ
ncbi:hypothetical protein Taro_001005 [Colocasia esculenta]|uniref:Uncharacterized protein n=1 Tax=Colocasia esculenta TaxID=4460 RepID=A0A843T9N9_COLES|nr:hypothetical protein [Colocasia esculenta]